MIYKAYDIRGIYPDEFSDEEAYKIGYFLPKLLNTDKVLVGRDARLSSSFIKESLILGITDSGADVDYIGLSTTPMVYYITEQHGYEASVQITASHNDKEYNGLKISEKEARPVGLETGLLKLSKMVKEEETLPSEKKGKVRELDFKKEYLDFITKGISKMDGIKVAVDCSDGMASLFARDIFGENASYINSEVDGSFPNHSPNPLDEKNCSQLKELVLKEKADIGIIFDGDADRVVFVDDKARRIMPDLIIAVLGEHYLKKEGETVLCDIRTSKSVTDFLEKKGAKPYLWKVGHAYAKRKLKELGAIYGGELAGHYYLSDFFNCDSGIRVSLLVLEVLKELLKKGKKLSEFIDEITKYSYSGEINYKVKEKDECMKELVESFEKPEKFYDFDGYRLEFFDWWFNVRASNTEDYLRLVLETKDEESLAEKKKILENIIKKYIIL